MKHFFILTLLPALAFTLPGNLVCTNGKNLEIDCNSKASNIKATSNGKYASAIPSYLKPTLSPQTVTTIPRKTLKVVPEKTYFTFDSTKQPLFAPGSSRFIQQLSSDAPVFAVHTSIILLHKKTNSIAFFTRPQKVAYGGHLELPSADIPYDYANLQMNKFSGLRMTFNDVLRFILAKCSGKELLNDAPYYFNQLVLEEQPLQFKGFASGPDRDLSYKEMKGIPPVSSAVFVTTFEDKGLFSFQHQQWMKKASSSTPNTATPHLHWIPLATVLSLAKMYTPQVHQQTFNATPFSVHKIDELKVEHFAFDHLKLVEAVFTA